MVFNKMKLDIGSVVLVIFLSSFEIAINLHYSMFQGLEDHCEARYSVVVLYSTAIWIAITVDSPNHQSEVFFFLVCCHNVVSIDGAPS